MMASERDCQHGSLGRSCELCERDARIAELEEVLRTTLGNIRSLKFAADGAKRTNVYDPWERVVAGALGVTVWDSEAEMAAFVAGCAPSDIRLPIKGAIVR